MATLGFPSNPSTGTVYTVGTRTWIWTGQGWKVDSGNTALNTLTAVSIVVTTSTNSTSTDSGAIKVVGGVGIGKDLTVGGGVFIGQTSTIGGYEILTTASVNQYANQTSIAAGTDTAVSTSTGAITIWNISTLQSVTDRGTTTTNAILIDNASVSTSNNTGALVVTGGVGIGGDLHVSGEIVAQKLTIQLTTVTTVQVTTDDIISTYNITNATSTNSGALQVAGGVGIGKDAFVGGVLYANNFNIYSTDTTSRIYGPVVIQNETSSTSINNGALQVFGGVGIRGDLHVGNIISNGLKVLTSNDDNIGFVSKILAGEDISVSTATGEVTVSDISTFQSVTNRGSTTTNALKILNYSVTTSSDTGALRVSGGVGIGGDVYIEGSITGQSLNLRDWATITNRLTVGSISITSNEDTNSIGAGALRIAGGMSISGNIFSTGNVYANGYLVNTGTFTGGTLSNKTQITNSETSTSTDTGALQVVGGVGIGRDLYAGGIGNFDHIITRGTATSMMYGPLQISDVLFVNSYLNSYSSTSGSLIVGGGAGIGLDLTVGGNLYVASSITATNFYGTFNGYITATGTVTTSSFTNAILGGNPGNLVYQSDTNQTGFVTTSTPGNILVSNGVEAPLYQNTLTLSGTQTSISTNTGALQVAGGVGVGGNLNVGGTIGGNYLQITGFDQVSTVSGFLDVGIIKSIASLDVFNASSTDTGALQVVGGAGIGGTVYIGQDLYVARKAYLNEAEILTTQSGFSSVLGISVVNQILRVTTSTNSTSTDTGALIVSGGVGIGGNLYVGGEIVAQKLTIEYTTVTTTIVETDDIIVTSNTSSAISTNTGALQVGGGLGVGGDAWVGGDIYSRGEKVLTTATVNQYANQTSIIAGTDTAISTSTGAITIWNTSTLQSVSDRGNSTTNAILILNNVASTSTTTGALTIVGGVGIGKDLYAGGDIYTNGQKVITTATVNQFANQTSIIAGTDTAVSTSTGAVTIWNTSTLQTITDRGNNTTNAVLILNTSASTSTTTGALIVAGGAAIGKKLFVGSDANINGSLTLAPVVWSYLPTTFTNIPVTYGQTSLTFTLEVDDTINGIQVSQGAGGYGPGSVNLTILGTTFPGGTSPANDIVFNVQTFQSPGPVYSTDVTSVVSYVSGTVPPRYDSIKSTGNVGIGAENSHWTFGTDGVLTLPDAGLITSVSGGISIYPTSGQAAVISNFSGYNQLYVQDSDVSIQTSPNNAGATFNTWVFSTAGNLTNPGAILVLSTANSTSTTTGALTVAGGVGVELDMYVGRDIFSRGSKVITEANTASLSAGFSSTSGFALSFNTGTLVNVAVSASTSNFATTSGFALSFNTGTLVNISIFASSSTYAEVSGVTNSLGTGTYAIINNTNSTSTNTGALTVVGGVGIGGTVNVGERIFINGAEVVTTSSVNQFANQTTIYAGTDTAVSSNSGTSITIWNTSTLQTVTGRGNSTTNTIVILNATAASSTNSGALQIVGGVGIGQDLYVGGSLYQNGQQVLTTASVNQFANQTSITAGTDTAVSTSTGAIIIWNTSTLQTVSDRGNSTTNAILITNATIATSTNSGALQVVGGVGIGGDLYIGGEIVAQKLTIQLTTVTTTQVTTDDIISTYNITNATSTNSGALQVAGGAGIGRNLYVGSTIYSSGNEVLTTATVNQFANQTSISAGVGISVNTSSGNVIVTNIGVTTATGSTYIGISTSSGNVIITNLGVTNLSSGTDITLSATTGSITINDVSTLQSVTGRGATTTNVVSFTNTTTSTSTATGAVVITGGLGVGGQINATSIVAGGVRTTTSSSAPADPFVGDIWYNTTNDRLYRYSANGVIDFWLDYTGPVVQYPTIF